MASYTMNNVKIKCNLHDTWDTIVNADYNITMSGINGLTDTTTKNIISLTIDWDYQHSAWTIDVIYEDETTIQYQDFTQFNNEDSIFTVSTLTLTKSTNVLQWFQHLLENDFYIFNLMYLYKLDGEKNRIDKSSYLSLLGFLSGEFKNSIGVKSLMIDIQNYPFAISSQYNYVYMQDLKRYYFIKNIDLVTSNITRLYLIEDVLYSWESLIKSQSAYITRSENYGDDDKVDNEVSTDYNRVISEEAITLTNDIYHDSLNSSAETPVLILINDQT